MFKLEDYYTVTTIGQGGQDTNPKLIVDITLNQDKIKEDANLLKAVLQNLEQLIGPYTIKVDSNSVKVKKKKHRKKSLK